MRLLYGIVVVLCVFVSEVAAQTSHAGTGYYIFYNGRERGPSSINFDSLPFFGIPADITYTETTGQYPAEVSIRETGGIGQFDTRYTKRFTPNYDANGTTVLKYDSDSLIFTTISIDSFLTEDKTVPEDDSNRWYISYFSFYAKAWIPLNTAGVAPEPTASVRFFPNPTSEVLNVRSAGTEAARVTIYDQLGKVVTAMTLSSQDEQLDVSIFARGTYTIIYESDGKQVCERFIKY